MQWTHSKEDIAVDERASGVCVDGILYNFYPKSEESSSSTSLTISVSTLSKDFSSWTELSDSSEFLSRQILLPEDLYYVHYLKAMACGEDVYVISRENVNWTFTSVLYCYNTRTCKWSRPEVRGEIPDVRYGVTCEIVGDSIYVLIDKMISPVEENQVFVLDLQTMRWSLLECNGKARRSLTGHHSAAVLGHRIYIFGVFEELSEDLQYFDTETLTWRGVMICGEQRPRNGGHSIVSIGGKLILFGSNYSYTDFRNFCEGIWVFDPRSCAWTHVQPMGDGPAPRHGQYMCQMENNKVIISGGCRYRTVSPGSLICTYLNDLFVLDMNPRLEVLCKAAILKSGISIEPLPRSLQSDIEKKRKSQKKKILE